VNNGIYFEFIPMDSFNGTNSHTVGLEDVQLNTDYAVVITTNGGLWRYLLGDTVKFVSLHPFRIKVSGRTAHFINAFGEEVIVTDAENAVNKACAIHHCDLVDFHAAPCYMNSKKTGGHQWIIEFKIPPEDLSSFTRDLDAALKEENSDYAAKRKGDLVLQLPNIVVAREGLFHRWLKSKNKLGGQNKVPRLSNNRDLITQLQALNDAAQMPA